MIRAGRDILLRPHSAYKGLGIRHFTACFLLPQLQPIHVGSDLMNPLIFTERRYGPNLAVYRRVFLFQTDVCGL